MNNNSTSVRVMDFILSLTASKEQQLFYLNNMSPRQLEALHQIGFDFLCEDGRITGYELSDEVALDTAI